MRKWFFIITIIFFGFVMFIQVNSIVSAKSRANTVTPITYPVTFATHKISGLIYQKLFKWNRPIQKAKIVAVNTDTKQTYTVYSNKQGKYSVTVSDGSYEIKAYMPYNKQLLPKDQKLTVFYDYQNINFYKDLLPW